MKLMNFKGRENKALFLMLDNLMKHYGFAFKKQDARDIGVWERPLGPTYKVVIFFTLNRTLPPNTWSLEPLVMIDSAYVALWCNTLRLYRDFYPVISGQDEVEYIQVLRFNPAHIRWQDRLDLVFPTLKGHRESLDDLKGEIVDVYENYTLPVLGQLRDPFAVAEFQLCAAKEFRATRITWEEGRYKVSTPYISTALLFDEAGNTARAVSFLKLAHEHWSRQISLGEADWAKPMLGQILRLLDHLNAKISRSVSAFEHS